MLYSSGRIVASFFPLERANYGQSGFVPRPESCHTDRLRRFHAIKAALKQVGIRIDKLKRANLTALKYSRFGKLFCL